MEDIFLMGVIRQYDKRTGHTYVYESFSYWDKEKNQSWAKRTLIGKIDSETGEIIPTNGRCKKQSPNYQPEAATGETTINDPEELKKMLFTAQQENTQLKKQVAALTKANTKLKERLAKLKP